jgi:hypothetical protein
MDGTSIRDPLRVPYKMPCRSGRADGKMEREKGFEPSTLTLAT